MIKRDVFDKATWMHDYSYPYLDTGFKFVWNDKDTYKYDERIKPEPGPGPTPSVDYAIMLNDVDFLVTEDWRYIWLETH